MSSRKVMKAHETHALTLHEHQLLFENMLNPFSYYRMVYDKQGNPVDYVFLAVNSAFERETGKTREEVLGKTVLDVFPQTELRWIHGFGRVATTGSPELFEDYAAALGQWYEVSAYSPKPDHFAITVQNVSIRKHKEMELLHLSYHDRLTGLYNRRFYEEEILRLDHPRNLPISVMMGDVNGLKLINDAFGHLQGDELLIHTAGIIKSACRKDDIVARWGGDEFVILLPKTTRHQAEEIAERIRISHEVLDIQGVRCSISLGWDTKTESGMDLIQVLKNAESLMYKNKCNRLEQEDLKGTSLTPLFGLLREKDPQLVRLFLEKMMHPTQDE